jgi:glycosyltransferase 2 family protein
LAFPENEERLDSPSKSTRRAAVVGLALGIPASLVFLWLAFRNANVDAVWDAARGADLTLVALAVAFIGIVYVFQAARWRRIAETARPGVPGYFELVVGAVACNNVLPGRLGELFRARWLAVAASIPSGRALATVGLDRGSDVVALVAFLLVSLPFVASAAWITRVVVGGVLLLFLLVVALLAARGYARLRHRDRRERGRWRRIARDIVDTLAEPLGRRRVLEALGLSALAWGSFAVAVWLVARSLGIELGPLDCIFVTAVLNLGVAIPSSPGFVGTYQWLAVAALGVFDVAREEALAFSFLLQASWYLPTTIVGGVLVLFRIDWGIRGRG